MSDPHLALMFLAAAGVSLLAKLPLGSISILTIQPAMTLWGPWGQSSDSQVSSLLIMSHR